MLVDRPLDSLGYCPVDTDQLLRDGVVIEDRAASQTMLNRLVVVFDAPRFSGPSPNGFYARHYGVHIGVDPERPRELVSILLTRGQSEPRARVVLSYHPNATRAIEAVNNWLQLQFGDYGDPDGLTRNDVTVADWERAAASHPSNPRGATEADLLLDAQLEAANEHFQTIYVRHGGWRYYGRPDATDPRGYAGPLFWQEEDVRFRYALELEREFPSAVHLNSLLSPATVAGWDAARDGRRQHVDILVDDLRGFREDDRSLSRFAARTATLFVEIKFIRRREQPQDIARDLEAIYKDAKRLGRHRRLGRCARAVMVVVDDENRFSAARNTMPWPLGVELLHARPATASAGALPPPWGPEADSPT